MKRKRYLAIGYFVTPGSKTAHVWCLTNSNSRRVVLDMLVRNEKDLDQIYVDSILLINNISKNESAPSIFKKWDIKSGDFDYLLV